MNASIDISDVVLQTERLTSRPWALSDLNDFREYASVEDVGRMAGWIPNETMEKSLEVLHRFVEEKKTFALVFQNKVVGSHGIEEYDETELPEFGNKLGREIGYALSKTYWGRGLMTEAFKEVTRYLFDTLKLDFIVCGHFVENVRSLRVQEKCGFRHVKLVKWKTEYGETKDCWLSVLERKENK